MRGVRWFSFLVFLLSSAALTARAEVPLKPAQGFIGAPSGTQQVTLGNSTVPLTGPWKFHIGDSPQAAGTKGMAWAQPDYDDSGWETVDLTPADAASGRALGGWGSRGHKGYAGYAWYRIRIAVHTPAGEKLALAGPANFDDAYQVFLNGRLLGGFGRFDGKRPEFFYSQPAVFPLANMQNFGAGDDAGEVIAFRFWMSPSTLLNGPNVGGLHTPPLLGTAEAIRAAYQLGWLDLVKLNLVWALSGVLYFVLAAIAFILLLFNRSDRVYLWMAASFLAMSVGGAETAIAAWTQAFTVTTELWICYVLVVPTITFVWFMLVWDWFRIERPRWLPAGVAVLALVLATGYAGELSLLYPVVPSALVPAFYLVAQGTYLVFVLLMIWLTIRYVLGHGVESWLLVVALLFSSVDWLSRQLTFLQLRRAYYPFGILLSLQQIAGFLFAMAMCALLLRRWVLSAQAQRVMAQEMKQAQEVQRLLIPEALPVLPGFALESEYRPAQQVGGDFFQIIAHPTDGSVLIVLGDVTGHGLQAAMLVSLLVGAIRTATDTNFGPMHVLQTLNQRLFGRSQANATCLALRLVPDGAVTLANAGHLPPYLNGKEMAMEGALPLGVIENAEFSLLQFQLNENDRLILITDGIIEAQNENQELFGFARTSELMRQQKSPAEIAAAAKAFGQQDDITVVRIVRAGVTESCERKADLATAIPIAV